MVAKQRNNINRKVQANVYIQREINTMKNELALQQELEKKRSNQVKNPKLVNNTDSNFNKAIPNKLVQVQTKARQKELKVQSNIEDKKTKSQQLANLGMAYVPANSIQPTERETAEMLDFKARQSDKEFKRKRLLALTRRLLYNESDAIELYQALVNENLAETFIRHFNKVFKEIKTNYYDPSPDDIFLFVRDLDEELVQKEEQRNQPEAIEKHQQLGEIRKKSQPYKYTKNPELQLKNIDSYTLQSLQKLISDYSDGKGDISGSIKELRYKAEQLIRQYQKQQRGPLLDQLKQQPAVKKQKVVLDEFKQQQAKITENKQRLLREGYELQNDEFMIWAEIEGNLLGRESSLKPREVIDYTLKGDLTKEFKKDVINVLSDLYAESMLKPKKTKAAPKEAKAAPKIENIAPPRTRSQSLSPTTKAITNQHNTLMGQSDNLDDDNFLSWASKKAKEYKREIALNPTNKDKKKSGNLKLDYRRGVVADLLKMWEETK